MSLAKCPRCNEKTYELLKTHSYCFCCNYSPDLDEYKKSTDYDLPIPSWAAEVAKEKHSTRENNSNNKNKPEKNKDAA